jgi:hypothetical protein
MLFLTENNVEIDIFPNTKNHHLPFVDLNAENLI